ncbi:MAG: substrate-binding domain-containing protein [Planctomycetia bacterium]|nr:substrate-binding domain-containing protein [Planctomycetia bacterium]
MIVKHSNHRNSGYTREVVIMWLLIVVFVVVLGVLGVWREYRYQKDYKPARQKALTELTKERLDVVFQGTGSSMIAPLYGAVRGAMAVENPVIAEKMQSYTPTSSEAGLTFLRQGRTNWVSSECPLPPFEQLEINAFQFPVLLVGLAVTVNVQGIENGSLRLSRQNLVDIFLGNIKSWNDPLIAANNPKLNLPEIPIVVMFRTKESGANYILSNYLCEHSEIWRNKIGKGCSVEWPVGTSIDSQREIIEQMKTCAGAISYVESSEAARVGLNVVQLENEAGQYVSPSRKAISDSLEYFDVEHFDDYSKVQVHLPGKTCYPLVGMNYSIIRINEKNPFKDAVAIAEFWEYINWCLDYNPLIVILGFHSCFVS